MIRRSRIVVVSQSNRNCNHGFSMRASVSQRLAGVRGVYYRCVSMSNGRTLSHSCQDAEAAAATPIVLAGGPCDVTSTSRLAVRSVVDRAGVSHGRYIRPRRRCGRPFLPLTIVIPGGKN